MRRCNLKCKSHITEKMFIKLYSRYWYYINWVTNVFEWASFSFIFRLFNKQYKFYNKINVKNIHPVSGAGIQSLDLLNINQSSPITTT